jgi:hypothetical protein
VTDNIGNTLHTSDPSATTTGSGSITYKGYSPSVSGTYTYTLKLNGEVKCSSTLTITGSITSCTLSPTTINASDNVTFTANTNKIANGTSCEIKDASGGSPSGLASNIVINNNECSSTFNPTQTGTYTVYIGGYNRSCGTVTVNVSSSSVEVSSSSVTPASSSGGSSITIANNQWNFTVASGTSVCFTNHPVVYDWQSSANILCNACEYEGCTVSFGTASGSGWDKAQLNIPLNASKTFSGCWVASRTDKANVVCAILDY